MYFNYITNLYRLVWNIPWNQCFVCCYCWVCSVNAQFVMINLVANKQKHCGVDKRKPFDWLWPSASECERNCEIIVQIVHKVHLQWSLIRQCFACVRACVYVRVCYVCIITTLMHFKLYMPITKSIRISTMHVCVRFFWIRIDSMCFRITKKKSDAEFVLFVIKTNDDFVVIGFHLPLIFS